MVVLVDDYERDLVVGAVRPRGQGLPREYDQEYDVSGKNLYQNNTVNIATTMLCLFYLDLILHH